MTDTLTTFDRNTGYLVDVAVSVLRDFRRAGTSLDLSHRSTAYVV
ncbi:MAG: hypothetical protein VYA59_02505 [Pseudomonadota bacterium]|nr:hypothetical protein [Pseudomonadota bacterium]